ncbi:hypothetical protein BOTBODRAFT_292542 [Botryobasidium botryosum FD-172 SS1]|uniref:Uncharacterized protein n=1 Tax=Botryobasidium botryosum (strain FD-172 SS1) TaxID=930990 RepID=A0A067MI62_BOTB1|nr:hypothetical protein BOTBODRAFT_292542 [Botryobasidium botryosum FD-172 SS1]
MTSLQRQSFSDSFGQNSPSQFIPVRAASTEDTSKSGASTDRGAESAANSNFGESRQALCSIFDVRTCVPAPSLNITLKCRRECIFCSSLCAIFWPMSSAISVYLVLVTLTGPPSCYPYRRSMKRSTYPWLWEDSLGE